MTARIETSAPRPRLDRVTADFSLLDQAAAIARIRRMADSGLLEIEIAARAGWSVADVRRAIGERFAAQTIQSPEGA